MLAERRDNARLQSDFYRDQFRQFLRWLIAVVFVILLLITVIAYLIIFGLPRQYYASTTEGKIMQMPMPHVSSSPK